MFSSLIRQSNAMVDKNVTHLQRIRCVLNYTLILIKVSSTVYWLWSMGQFWWIFMSLNRNEPIFETLHRQILWPKNATINSVLNILSSFSFMCLTKFRDMKFVLRVLSLSTGTLVPSNILSNCKQRTSGRLIGLSFAHFSRKDGF